MKLSAKIVLISSMSFIALSGAYATDICTSCLKVQGLPQSPSILEIEKLAKNDKIKGTASPSLKVRSLASEPDPDKIPYINKYCLQFEQIPKEQMGNSIREMEASPYKIEDYFEHSRCQPGYYSDAVKSPMIHTVADDPNKHEEKLNTIWLYYLKKRKEPEIFTRIINVQNTEGETILDYIETVRIKGGFGDETLKGPVTRIIAMLCGHGAVYSAYPKKECPK